MPDKNVTLKNLPSEKEDYALFIEHDVDSITVKAVLKSQVDKVLEKYNTEFIEELYDNDQADWEDVEETLSKGAIDVEHISVFTF